MATKRTIEVELSTTGLGADGKPQRIPLGAEGLMSPPLGLEPEMRGENMLINIGPQHPATHGVLRLVLELDGETVVRCIPHVGYLHCGFEKIGEYRQYNQIIPWTDREDYLNSMGNNVSFVLGEDLVVRKLKFLDGAVDQLENTERDSLNAELDARFPGHPGSLDVCSHQGNCSIRSVWQVLGEIIHRVLRGTSLADLCLQEERLASHFKDTLEPALLHIGGGTRGGSSVSGGAASPGTE